MKLSMVIIQNHFTSSMIINTKLNARLALRQRADLLVANISTNRISLPQGQRLPFAVVPTLHSVLYFHVQVTPDTRSLTREIRQNYQQV